MPGDTAALTYRSYAKINLYLDVLTKRSDGYNNIETLFHTVSLFDQLSFREEPAGRIVLTCSTRDLDTGEGNLVHRAATLLRQRSGCEEGARMHLEKHIPIAAGLAGGSGNAAATLIGLNVMWDLRWSLERLQQLALELGSDVPYCILGGAAAATGRGEELSALPPLEDVWFVLVHPPIAVSASHTYNHPELERNLEQPDAGRTLSFSRAIRRFEAGELGALIFNRMDAPVLHDHTHLVEARDRLLELGCLAAAISGSGPTLFGLCPSKRDAGRIAEAVTDYETSVVCTVPHGVERIA